VIGAVEGKCHAPAYRGDIDDSPLSLLPERGQDLTTDTHETKYIRLKLFTNLIFSEFLKRSYQSVSSVIDYYINAAMRGDGISNRAPNRIMVGNVESLKGYPWKFHQLGFGGRTAHSCNNGPSRCRKVLNGSSADASG
jgi:hypothetical protein